MVAIARALSPQTDLDTPGARVERTPEGLVAAVDPARQLRAKRILAVGAAVVLGAFAFFLDAWGRYVLGGLAVLALVGLFRARLRDDRTLLAPEGVSVVEDGKVVRRISAAEVEAVALTRVEEPGGGGDGAAETRYLVSLRIPGSRPWIAATSRHATKSRRFAEDASIALGKPLVDESGNLAARLSPDEVNLPLVERLRRGLLASENPGPPPPGVALRRLPQGVEVASPHRHWGAFAGLGLAGAMFVSLGSLGVVAILVASAESAEPWIRYGLPAVAVLPGLFVVLGAGLLAAAVGRVTGESYVRITRSGLVHGVRRFGRDASRSADLRAFEDLRVSTGVVLVGDEEERRLGFDHLGPAAQKWVAAAILHALVKVGPYARGGLSAGGRGRPRDGAGPPPRRRRA